MYIFLFRVVFMNLRFVLGQVNKLIYLFQNFKYGSRLFNQKKGVWRLFKELFFLYVDVGAYGGRSSGCYDFGVRGGWVVGEGGYRNSQ